MQKRRRATPSSRLSAIGARRRSVLQARLALIGDYQTSAFDPIRTFIRPATYGLPGGQSSARVLGGSGQVKKRPREQGVLAGGSACRARTRVKWSGRDQKLNRTPVCHMRPSVSYSELLVPVLVPVEGMAGGGVSKT